MEQWAKYNFGYEVSDFGRVRKNGKIYNCRKDKKGYLKFSRYYLHQVVFDLFVYPTNHNEVIHFMDGNKENVHISNLYLMEKGDHISFHNSGENHWNCILFENEVIDMCEMKKIGLQFKEIYDKYKHMVSKSHLYRILAGKRWKHISRNMFHFGLEK